MSALTHSKSKTPLLARVLIFSGALLFIIDAFWCAGYWIIATRAVKESLSFSGVDAFVPIFLYVMFPVFLVSTVICAGGVLSARNASKLRGRCRKCGYDRRADSGTNCPECGYAEESVKSAVQ